LDIPADVTVSRQVLAEPAPALAGRTWARLSDGTPLVTAARRGSGTVVLFHVTANRDWSNLPISGLFVEMLRRTVALSQASATTGEDGTEAGATRERELLNPVATLNGFGRLGTPPATATAITIEQFESAERSPRHPPGLYGTAASPRALNL
ncbi:MAG: LytTR family transcriptional regulator, partial [Alphaproteobacteria bacterium]